MAEPTRPLPPLIPLPNGGWRVDSYMSSAEFTIRGLGLVPPDSIVPVIVVPGIMGSNLRAKLKPRLVRIVDERNEILKPGEAAWRPPNGKTDGLWDSFTWDNRSPKERQKIFAAATLEVDDGGPVELPSPDDDYVLVEADLRQRGWGEVHADSYGVLLHALQVRLNQSFGFDDRERQRIVRQHWREVMDCAPSRWGMREFAALSEAELEKHARHYFPVYAVGYNWLESCASSSQRLEQRIDDIVDSWRKLKRRCDKVILVTHSMGGLVARACAKRIPDRIAGVIHGVMPALGAPAAYRRMACGTEAASPSNSLLENLSASRTAKILGEATEKTTPVLAFSPGALELLPNHLYPGPWLLVRVMQAIGPAFPPSYEMNGDNIRFRETAYDYLHLPNETIPNPYDLYRDMKHWYRLINPALADPIGKYLKSPLKLEEQITSAIDTAENFHRSLGDYYHPNTYAFYGDDPRKLSFGHVRWVARQAVGAGTALTAANVANAQYLSHTPDGRRCVLVEGKTELHFAPEQQGARGDGTVPHQSGMGPEGKVRQLFATHGYDHQGSYKHEDMLLLTLRLIAKIVQEIP